MDSLQVWLDGVPQWLRDWGVLLGTFMLLGVTGWYAYLTKRLAQSSERSSAAARDAAEAAKTSALLAQAGTDVDFTIDVGENSFGGRPPISVTCAGATVYIHRVTMRLGYGHSRSYSPAGDGAVSLVFIENDVLTEVVVDTPLPRRLHRGESQAFLSPSDSDDSVDSWSTLLLDIDYSFDGLTVAGVRLIRFDGSPQETQAVLRIVDTARVFETGRPPQD